MSIKTAQEAAELTAYECRVHAEVMKTWAKMDHAAESGTMRYQKALEDVAAAHDAIAAGNLSSDQAARLWHIASSLIQECRYFRKRCDDLLLCMIETEARRSVPRHNFAGRGYVRK